MYIIAGLGNPGEEYKNTRHNTGRIILENIIKVLSKDADFSEFGFDKKTKALISDGKIGKEKVMMVMPDDFMNNSGASVKPLVKSKKQAEQLIVIHDDLDLPIGRYKMSFNRGSGGHKGVDSVVKNIKTEAFMRFRIGISPVTPGGKMKKPSGEKDVTSLIMGHFKDKELDELKKISKKLAEAVVMMIEEGREKAMSVYNRG